MFAVEHAAESGQFLAVVQPAQDAVVEDAGQRCAGLALHEGPEIPDCALDEAGTPHHQQLFPRCNVAEEMDAAALGIDLRDRADIQLVADADGERVVGQFFVQRPRFTAEMLAQRLDERHHPPAAVDDVADLAPGQRRADHVETGIGRFEVLALQHTEADALADFQEHDHCMVLELALAVVNPGMGEVQLAAGRAADEQARETARVVQRFHEERFRRGQPVDHHIGQRVPMVDVDVDIQHVDRLADLRHPLLDRQRDLPAATQVLAAQRHRDQLRTLDQRRVKTLDDNAVPAIAGLAVQAARARAQFTGGRAQDDRYAGKAPGNLACHCVDIDMRRHVDGHEGRRGAKAGQRGSQPGGTGFQRDHATLCLRQGVLEAVENIHVCISQTGQPLSHRPPPGFRRHSPLIQHTPSTGTTTVSGRYA